MAKQRILWLHPHFLNWMGGHKYVYEIASRLSKDYDVVIASDIFSSEAKEKFREQKIKIQKLSGISTNNPLYWALLPLFLIKDCLILRKFIKKTDIVFSSMFPMNVIAMLIGNKYLQLCYEPFAFFYDKNFVNGFFPLQRFFINIANLLYSWSDKLATGKASIVLTLSEYNRRWVKDVYNLDSVVVYEGVDIDFFKKRHDLKIYDTYKKYKIIFHSTDFTKIKGTDFLFRAMLFIKQSIPNVKLLVSSTVQNIHQKKNLINYAKAKDFENSVEFLGYLPYELLPVYLSMADLVVQPSIGQSMNLTVKEAMSCSTAVITSPEGKEQFADGDAGFLVNPRDSEDLARKITFLLKNKGLAEKMGKNGARIIKEKFSWQTVYIKIKAQIEILQDEKE